MAGRRDKGLSIGEAAELMGRLNVFDEFRNSIGATPSGWNAEDAFHLFLLSRFNDEDRYRIVADNRMSLRLLQDQFDKNGTIN